MLPEGSSLVVVSTLLSAVASRVGPRRLRRVQVSVAATLGSAAVAHRLSCLMACGIPRPGTENRVLHGKVNHGAVTATEALVA